MTSIHIGIKWGLSCEIGKGKVRSGFDVSSAVYGSQRYVRFSLEVLSSAQFKHFADKVIVEEQVERMMSGDAVEPINDGISEFNVEFHCPKESIAEGIVDMMV
ncbi:uncharacterized protein LOC114277492 [Camellia sinensis]|uniref:uncharacterized protein LOC114277492 n=1 Tax=Camellia sinensis TaxID=4442 RepID=UPI00103673F6|nr:uncharacterized protein LOC114277492 [Camellia sinensis]XP_028075193.1 uncharacterized protein LOC114277492 [Camellia sinensis]